MRMGFPGIMSPSLQRGKFVPSDINGIFLWLDADDGTTITKSSGLVSQWNDKSGGGLNVTQGTADAKPTTNATSLNNKNVLDFDGGDQLAIPSGIFTIPNGSNTVFTVAKRTSEDATLDVTVGMATGARDDWFDLFSNVSGVRSFKNRVTAAGTVSSTGNTNTNFNICTSRRSGTTQGISVNGETEITDTNGEDVATIDDAFVGSGGSGGFPLIGSIGEIIVYNRSLSVLEIKEVNEYLSAKWAIALV